MPAVTDVPGIAGGYETMNSGAGMIARGLVNPSSGQFNNNRACAAMITIEDYSVHFTTDGTTPTTAATTNVGHRMDAGESTMIRGISEVNNFEYVDRVAGSNATVKVTVYYPHDSSSITSGPIAIT